MCAFYSGVHQQLRAFVHFLFALAAFDFLPRCLYGGVCVHLLASRVNHDELSTSRLYAVFVAHGALPDGYYTPTACMRERAD